jgi:hypothetical protein
LIDSAGFQGNKKQVDALWREFKEKVFNVAEEQDRQQYLNVFHSAIEAYFRCSDGEPAAFGILLELVNSKLIPTVKTAGVFAHMYSYTNSPHVKSFTELRKSLDK